MDLYIKCVHLEFDFVRFILIESNRSYCIKKGFSYNEIIIGIVSRRSIRFKGGGY